MDLRKKKAAESALSTLPLTGVIGLGSGSTVAVFAQILARRKDSVEWSFSVVPTSFQAHQLALKYKFPITSLDINPILDVTIDGADEVDKNLNLTKGGGGALFREKIVASASKRLIIIIDESKLVDKLATRFKIPIEVFPPALSLVTRRLKEMGITPILREAKEKVGPVITDNGNFILDLEFSEPIENPENLAIALKMIPGVIETGLFVGMADEVHVGTETSSYVLYRK